MKDTQVVRARLEQAAKLIASCHDLVKGWTPKHLGEEIERREIELAGFGLLSWAVDLMRELRDARLTLKATHCPHCAWAIPPRSVARCPRCNLPREVVDEPPREQRRAS